MTGVRRGKAIGSVLVQGPRDPVAIHQKVAVSNGLPECHHGLARIQLAFEQNRKKSLGGLRFDTKFLESRHTFFVVVDELTESFAYAEER